MGLIITSFMIGITSPSGESFIGPALIGNLGAIVGSIVSVRLMLMFTAKEYGKTEMCEVEGINAVMYTDYRMVRPAAQLPVSCLQCWMAENPVSAWV